MKSKATSAARRSSCHPVWSAVFMALIATSVTPTASAPLSLDEARRIARREAPTVTAQSARVVAAREEVARAGALPDPTLQLGIDNLIVTGDQAFDVGADFMTMRRIGVSQAWPARRKREAEREVAAARADTQDLKTESTRLEVERRAGEAWIAVWSATAERRFLQERVTESDRAVSIAKAQLANGTGTASDALSAQMVRAELDNERRRAKAQIEVAHASLVRWAGEVGTFELAAMPATTTLRVAADELRAGIDRYAFLQVWQGEERTALAAAQLAEAEKRPDLGFAVAYGARSGRPDMMMFEVSVGLPLFTRNRQDRGIAARYAEHDAVQAEREDARRAQREALELQLAGWSSLRDEQQRYQNTLLPLARDRCAVALASYASAGPLRPWIEAHRDEIELRRRALQVEADLARLWLALDTLLPGAPAPEVSS